MPKSRSNRGTEWFHDTFDANYPSLYGHRDLREARELLDRLGARLLHAGGRVLDVGCGPGRYLQALQEIGERPIGVDLSQALLLFARREVPEAPLVRADMRLLPFRPGSFRLVLLMFTTFGYFASDEEHRSVLQGIATLLDGDGLFFLDYVNARHLRAHLVASSRRRVERYTVEERRWIEGEGRFLHKESRIVPVSGGGERIYRERLRLYDPEEIDEMLDAAGLRPQARLGDYHARPFTEAGSKRYLVIARRKEGSE